MAGRTTEQTNLDRMMNDSRSFIKDTISAAEKNATEKNVKKAYPDIDPELAKSLYMDNELNEIANTKYLKWEVEDMLYGVDYSGAGDMYNRRGGVYAELYGNNFNGAYDGTASDEATGGYYGERNATNKELISLKELYAELEAKGQTNNLSDIEQQIAEKESSLAELSAKIAPLEIKCNYGVASEKLAEAYESRDKNPEAYEQALAQYDEAKLPYLELVDRQSGTGSAEAGMAHQERQKEIEEIKVRRGIEDPQPQTQTQTQTAQVTEPDVKSNSVEKTATVEPEKEEKELTPEEQLESLQAQRDARVASGINSASDAKQLSELDNQIKSLKSDLGIEDETKTADASDVKAQGSEEVKQTDEKKSDTPDFEMPERPEGMPDDVYNDIVNEKLADEIWTKGNWGNGAERVEKLTAAGFDASAVQAKINEKYYSVKTDDISTEHISLNDEIKSEDLDISDKAGSAFTAKDESGLDIDESGKGAQGRFVAKEVEAEELAAQEAAANFTGSFATMDDNLDVDKSGERVGGAFVSSEQAAKNAEKAEKSKNQRRPLTDQQASSTNTEIKRTEPKAEKTKSEASASSASSQSSNKGSNKNNSIFNFEPDDFQRSLMHANTDPSYAASLTTAGNGKAFGSGEEVAASMARNWNLGSLDSVAGNNSTTAKSAELEQE